MLCAVPLQAGRRCTHQGEAVGDSALPPLHLQVLPAQPHLDSGNKGMYGKRCSHLRTRDVLEVPPWHLCLVGVLVHLEMIQQ